jgi:hypothetical protein
MRQEECGPITDQELDEAVCTGEVIETYPEDTPYPSVLLFGTTHVNRPLHAVCAYDSEADRVVIVTVYQPDPRRWENYRRRKRCNVLSVMERISKSPRYGRS